jgi:hypothetical protein
VRASAQCNDEIVPWPAYCKGVNHRSTAKVDRELSFEWQCAIDQEDIHQRCAAALHGAAPHSTTAT